MAGVGYITRANHRSSPGHPGLNLKKIKLWCFLIITPRDESLRFAGSQVSSQVEEARSRK